ncbi:putative transcription factor B3-Domain family [Helianthus anomalus]
MVILNLSEYHQWEVCIRKIGPYYCIADGWFKFIEDLRLNPGDILCFQIKDVKHFHIIIFNKNGRQVLLNNTPLIEQECEHISNVEGYRQVSDDPNYPFFAMTVTHQLVKNLCAHNIDGHRWFVNQFIILVIISLLPNVYILLTKFFIFFYHRYGVVGWHDILQAEHISLGEDCFFNWSKTNSRLLVTKLQLAEVLP